jgi:hypothetical protein
VALRLWERSSPTIRVIFPPSHRPITTRGQYRTEALAPLFKRAHSGESNFLIVLRVHARHPNRPDTFVLIHD